MKKYLLPIIILLFGCIANAQTEIKKEYYESGILKSETPFVDGKICGSMKKYFKDGKIESESV